MSAVLDERPPYVPLAAACRALGVHRGGIYARRAQRERGVHEPRRSRRHAAQPRALDAEERAAVLACAAEPRFIDQPVFEIHRTLLDEGVCLCSLSTFHRILRRESQNGDRRVRREPQRHAVPRLEARAPNEVWTWDCSKMPTRTPGIYLTLYAVMDLYSRYVVAWMVSAKENAALATQLMAEATSRYRVRPGQLTIHQDRGAPMTAHRYIDQMLEIGVGLSHSRPRVSNDNPHIESGFATLKGQPDWPGKFDDTAHGRRYCASYFEWYNHEHHHAGLAGFTPEQVFTGRHETLLKVHQSALDARYATHPERFVAGAPCASAPPTTVTINPVSPDTAEDAALVEINIPTLPRVREKSKLIQR